MKILSVSDLHFGLGQFDWVVQQVPSYDAVIIAGDLLDIAGHLDLDSQITVVTKYLRTISGKSRLFVCSGNHDGDEKNDTEEFVAKWLQRVRAEGLVVDASGTTLNGWRISVCPWWDGPATRETMQRFLHAEAALSPSKWIWLHHAPPDQLGVSWTGKVHAGDTFLGATIRELSPDFVFSGHIHNSPFRSGGASAGGRSSAGNHRVDERGVDEPRPYAGIELHRKGASRVRPPG